MSVEDACLKAVAAADHLDREGVDAAAVEALLALARKIDAWDVIAGWALDDAGGEGRPAVPANDNTSLGSFLKFCESLGLTPVGRKSLDLGGRVEVDPVDELKRRRVEAAQRAAARAN